MPKKIITLDPGHGQYVNKSSNNPKYIEGTQMWLLANKLKAELEAYGFEVVTTRPKISDDPTTADRGATAGKNGSSLFLSLHSNAPGRNEDGSYSESVTGSVVFYSMTRPENKVLADALGNKVSELMGHYYRGSKTKQYPDRPGVDYYSVIRNAAQYGCKCALIIEHGFHTNVKDSIFLLVDENLQELAEAEAAIIAEYFGQTKETATSDELYRVQIGAYSVKANAEKQLARAKAAGFADAFLTTTGGQTASAAKPTTAKKTDAEIAREVIDGRWGNGTERKQRLSAAGYDYATIQKLVNKLLS